MWPATLSRETHVWLLPGGEAYTSKRGMPSMASISTVTAGLAGSGNSHAVLPSLWWALNVRLLQRLSPLQLQRALLDAERWGHVQRRCGRGGPQCRVGASAVNVATCVPAPMSLL